MFALVIVALVSYLVGSLPAGYLAGRVAGIDIRKAGSGNIGATNVVRVLGRRFGYPVFLVDFLKGLAAVEISILFFDQSHSAQISRELFEVIAGVCCVIGHAFPVWLGFKGGKGVATSGGVIFGLMPLAAFIMALVWIVTFQMTRYVSVASVTSALALPVLVGVMLYFKELNAPVLLYFSICLAAIVAARHRSNFSRLIHGVEPRFQRK